MQYNNNTSNVACNSQSSYLIKNDNSDTVCQHKKCCLAQNRDKKTEREHFMSQYSFLNKRLLQISTLGWHHKS